MGSNPTLDKNGLWTDDVGKMSTFTGLRVNPLVMTADDVDIVDIARSLSRQCRYNGHVGYFYSVARHCLLVADRLAYLGYGRLTQFNGLLHDAAEGYLGDMIRPLKQGEIGDVYMLAEERLEAEISEKFGLRWPWPKAVREADRFVCLNMEMPRPHGLRWTWDSTPQQDEEAFLSKFYELENK